MDLGKRVEVYFGKPLPVEAEVGDDIMSKF
jgi:hypothetical protein